MLPRLFFTLALLSVPGMTGGASLASARDLIVSANDGKFSRVQGAATFPLDAPPDNLVLIDAAVFPPRLLSTVRGIEHTLVGPPQAVAITPDGTLAVIGAPSRYDHERGEEIFGHFLQVVDLQTSRVLSRLEIGAHPNGLAINPQGSLLLAACLDGTLKVLRIEAKSLRLVDSIRISDGRLSGVSFTHDGRSALALRRDVGGAAVLEVSGNQVSLTSEHVSTGIAPYAIDVSSTGEFAVISNVGLAGLKDSKAPGDADSITLVNVTKRPFRTIQYLTVPSIPEGIAISPDGQWIVAQSMDGSNLPLTDPGRGAGTVGRVTLFAIKDGWASKVNEVASGEAAQGIVFAKDNKTVLVQFNVERSLAVFQIRGGRLVDTTERLTLDAGPASIRSMPR